MGSDDVILKILGYVLIAPVIGVALVFFGPPFILAIGIQFLLGMEPEDHFWVYLGFIFLLLWFGVVPGIVNWVLEWAMGIGVVW